MNEIAKMVVVTTFICAFSATLLGGLKEGLGERIRRQEDIYIRGPAIHHLLQGSPNDPLKDKVDLSLEGKTVSVYPWIEEGKVRRIALEWTGKGGYGGDVIVMTALDLESDRIYGVEVTQHKETPGVGTRAMTESYLKQYVKHTAKGPIRLKKDGGDIDAVSGATRSSTAIADAVHHAASFVLSHKDQIVRQIMKKEVAS